MNNIKFVTGFMEFVCDPMFSVRIKIPYHMLQSPDMERKVEYYEGKSLNNRNFVITFCKSTYRNCLCLIFRHSPPASQHSWSTCPQACGCPLEKSSTCYFTVSLATLTGLPLRCSSLTYCRPFWTLSTHSYTLPWLKQLSPYWTFILIWFQKVSHPLTTKNE